MKDDLFAALAAHDDLLARRSVDVWIGGEPTFTRPDSVEPAWTSAAEGDDKLARAHALATALAEVLPGSSVSRVIGRTYLDEAQPRFAFGVRWRDDGTGEAARVAIDAEPTPPPSELADDRWLSVTPDPGVVEVNMAPSATSAAFYAQALGVWEAATAAGLAPVRARFNGDLADSGGGGQLTLGGARPETSPFIRYPHLLPALIRYLNNHPSLSYWFASECVGSASQGPRPDEGARERFDELELGLGWLEQIADRGELAPEQLWHALGPLLVDPSGNSHRAELNVEKLWNPHVAVHGPRHGKMGVVELRAIRMPERPEMLAALAALLGGIIGRLIVADYREPLIDWHDDLHDRFALPAALARDLRFVLGDLDQHGLGLPGPLRYELELWRSPGIACRLGDATLTIRPALEFWPLVGDVASQEHAASRLVDASSQRWELSIEGAGPDRVAIAGRWLALRALADNLRAVGVRRRIFQPSPGFHPGLAPTDPLVIEWAWAGRSQRIELWAWRPSGGAYDGLPLDDGEALARRNERIVIATHDHADLVANGFYKESRPFTIDLRLPLP
ncbi:MAG: transglutaminase family protein [Kofleriaceae bacterium]